MAITGESFKDDDRKYGQDSHQYEGFASKAVEGMSVATDLFSKTSSLSVSFAKPRGGDADGLKKNIASLLEHGGIKDVEFNDLGNNSTFYIKVPEREGQSLVAVATALAATIDLPRGETLYNVLDKSDAEQILKQELARTNMTLQQAGLVGIGFTAMENTAQRYGDGAETKVFKDVDLGKYPFGAIEALTEDSPFSKFAGERTVRIDVRDGMAGSVLTQLKEAGLDAVRPKDQNFVTVNADTDTVVKAMGKKGLLPDMIVAEVTGTQPPVPAAPAAAAPAVVAAKPQVAAMKM